MHELWMKAWAESEKEAPIVDLLDVWYVLVWCFLGVGIGICLTILYGMVFHG